LEGRQGKGPEAPILLWVVSMAFVISFMQDLIESWL